MSLFSGALHFLSLRLEDHSDGLLPGGRFHWADDSGLELAVWNANNHQTTYGVLQAAVSALSDCMSSRGAWGTVRFWIFDGGREVGGGEIY